MDTFTVEVRIPEALRERLDERARAQGAKPADYLRELVERDLSSQPPAGMTFREILAPAEGGFEGDEDELAEFLDDQVRQHRAERRAREAQES
jgi:hypothetical protein